MDWFYAIGSEQLGPVSTERLNAMLAAGEVSNETLVWHDEMTEWEALGNVTHMLGTAPEAPSAEGAMATDAGSCSVCGKTFPSRDLGSQNGVPVCVSCQGTMPVTSAPVYAEVEPSFDWGPCEVGNIWNRAWALFKRNMGSLVMCFFIMIVLSIVVSGLAEVVNHYTRGKIGIMILTQVVSGWASMCLTLGMIKYFLDVADHGEGSLGSLFAYPLPAVFFLLAGYMMGIVTLIGFLLLVIPGIYILCRCYLFTTFGVDKEINGFEALGQCWERTGPYVLQLFVIAIVQFFVAISGLILLGVGFLLTGPLAVCMSIVAYRTIQPRSQ
jgi:hypothetical protein